MYIHIFGVENIMINLKNMLKLYYININPSEKEKVN